MKTIVCLVMYSSLLLISCNPDKDSNLDSLGEFKITVNDHVFLDQDDMEYYDFSSHLIYLKESSTFLDSITTVDTFKVFADGVEIYSGFTVPLYVSMLYPGPNINTQPSFYGNYILAIEFREVCDNEGNCNEDPRSDNRIIHALSKNDQYHAGIQCDIVSIQYISPEEVRIEIRVKNNDSYHYYIMDPDKMGRALFHYFTTGLHFINYSESKFYTHNLESTSPDPWDSWSLKWLTLIRSGETKTFTISYDSFDPVNFGEYRAYFEWPGLSYQVKKSELDQEDGRIWLGKIPLKKEISIN